MTIQEKIIKFIEKYGEDIRKDYMPAVKLSGRKSPTITINKEYEEANESLLYSYYSKIFCPYLLYDEELDVLALAIGQMSSSKTGGEQRDWTGNVYYIVDHKKQVLDKEGSKPYYFYGKATHYYARSFLAEFSSYPTRAVKELKRFLGDVFRYGSRLVETYLWCLKEWFMRKEPTQKTIEIANLGDVSNVKISTQEVDEIGYSWHTAMETILEANERYDVIRCFSKNEERERIYLDTKTDKIFIFYCVNGKWEKTNNVSYYNTYLINKESVDTYFDKTRRLKYLKNIIANDKTLYVKNIYTPQGYQDIETNYIEMSVFNSIKILRYPILEKLYKAGYKNIYSKIDTAQPKAWILEKFGVYNPKSKTIYGTLGVNKFQLDFIESKTAEVADRYYDTNVFRILSRIKEALGKINLSDLDNTQFQSIYTFVEGMSVNGRYGYRGNRFWKQYEEFTHNIASFTAMANRVNKIAQQQVSGIYQIYSDIINTYDNCKSNRLDVIEIDFNELRTYNDFVRMHDYYSNIYNAYRERCRREYDKVMKEQHEKIMKAYEKLYKDRKIEFEYSYGDYLFKIPQNPEEELTTEGGFLHHCVAGYSTRVLSGNTNIIFLREKTAPTIPFMTIEVREGKVIQCHGSHNAWLGSCEKYQKAIPAVMYWLHDKKIKCHHNILTSKAMGYSDYGTGNIELPEVSFDVKEILI